MTHIIQIRKWEVGKAKRLKQWVPCYCGSATPPAPLSLTSQIFREHDDQCSDILSLSQWKLWDIPVQKHCGKNATKVPHGLNKHTWMADKGNMGRGQLSVAGTQLTWFILGCGWWRTVSRRRRRRGSCSRSWCASTFSWLSTEPSTLSSSMLSVMPPPYASRLL